MGQSGSCGKSEKGAYAKAEAEKLLLFIMKNSPFLEWIMRFSEKTHSISFLSALWSCSG